MFRPTRMPIGTLLLALVLTTAACRNSAPSETDQTPSTASFATPLSNQAERHREDADHAHAHLDEAGLTDEVKAVLVPSELVLGPNRFAVGLFDVDGGLVHEADVHFHYYDLSDPQKAVLESEVDAQRLQTPDGSTTIFTHERDFGRAGEWGAEIQVRWPGGRAARQRISFEVLADSPSLSPGEEAPLLQTPTLFDVDQNLSHLTSASEPNPALHRLSLAAALSSDKPTLLLIATPSFCQTRFCGPAYEIVSELQKRYEDRLNYVYVEAYTGLPNPAASGWKMAPIVTVFGLQSEPWLYLIDAQGTIVYRVEGMFTVEEVDRHLQTDVGL